MQRVKHVKACVRRQLLLTTALQALCLPAELTCMSPYGVYKASTLTHTTSPTLKSSLDCRVSKACGRGCAHMGTHSVPEIGILGDSCLICSK